jgi:hypothetical protein
MPGTRSYQTYGISNGHWTWFGGSIGFTVNVLGTLPSLTSLTPFGSQTMVLYWNNSNPAGAEVHIEQSSVGATGPWTEIGTDTASPFTQTGLSAGTRYWYRIRSHSHSAGGYSSYSAVANARTTPAIPPGSIGASFNSGGPTGVSLCWTSSFGATYYIVLAVQAGNGNVTTVQANPNSSCYGSNLGSIALYFNDAYHFAVKACNESGCSGYKDPSTPNQYWTWLPCTDGSGVSCSGGGTPDTNSHSH